MSIRVNFRPDLVLYYLLLFEFGIAVTPNVAKQSGLTIQTPSEFIQEIRSILTQEL